MTPRDDEADWESYMGGRTKRRTGRDEAAAADGGPHGGRAMTPRSDTTVRLEETNTELLLFISANQKKRAKRIEGRVWDADRACWVYPKLATTYDAIVTEFGDELHDLSVSRPDGTAEAAAWQPGVEQAQLVEENSALRRGVERLRRSLPVVGTDAVSKSKREADLKAALAEQERRIASLEDQIDRAAALSAEQKATILELQARNEELSTQPGTPRPDDVMKQVYAQVLLWAVKGSSDNGQFVSLIKSIKSLDRYPLELAIALERVLRRRLRSDEGVSLYYLIGDAEDVGILDREAADLAHTLRKQRNIAAHQVGPKGVEAARAMLCLFAASLLWRSFLPRSPS